MRNAVKKSVSLLLLAAVLVFGLLFSAVPAQAAATDEILNFTVTVDVNEDASLSMVYHIEWKVLYDGGGSEKLEWVDLGVPNKYHENIEPLSDTIKRIEDNGSKLAIYLDRGYGKNEVVTFEFSMKQDHMYQIDKYTAGETVYTFTPAWFDDFTVDELVIRWNSVQAGAWQPDCMMDDEYLVFSKQLSPGERFTMSVTYPNDAFGFDEDRQSSKGGGSVDPVMPTGNGGNGGGNGGSKSGFNTFFEIIGGLFGLAVVLGFIIGPIVLIVKFIKWIAGGTGFGTETATEKKMHP